MTARTRQSLKNIFENGDETSTANFSDLIDSFLNFSDTSAQTVLSPVTLSALKFTTASGTTLETSTITTSGLRVTGTLSADTALVAMGDVSASSMNITASVSASSLDFNNVFVGGAPLSTSYGSIRITTSAPTSAATTAAGVKLFAPFAGVYEAYGTQTNFSAVTTGQLKYKGPNGLLLFDTTYNGYFKVLSQQAAILTHTFRVFKTNAAGSASVSGYTYGTGNSYDALQTRPRIVQPYETLGFTIHGVVSAGTSSSWDVRWEAPVSSSTVLWTKNVAYTMVSLG